MRQRNQLLVLNGLRKAARASIGDGVHAAAMNSIMRNANCAALAVTTFSVVRTSIRRNNFVLYNLRLSHLHAATVAIPKTTWLRILGTTFLGSCFQTGGVSPVAGSQPR